LGQNQAVFNGNSDAKSFLEELEKKEKELTTGQQGGGQDKETDGKPEGGKPEGGKPEGGKPEGGKPEGGKPEGGKTVDSIKEEIRNQYKDDKKVDTAVQNLAKKDEYKELLKGVKSLEEAMKRFQTVEDVQKFRTALDAEHKSTQTGFAAHMKRF
jgi:hypothetical protein